MSTNSPPFGLDEAGASILVRAGVPFAFAPGAVVFRSGDPCPGYFLIRHGELSVRERSPTGREIQIYTVGPGEACLQTAVCLMGGEVYSAEGVVTQATEGLLLSQAAFEDAMARSPAFRRMVMRSIAQRLKDFSRAIESVAFRPLIARLAEAILDLCDGQGAVAMTHDQLALQVGATRESVSRGLGDCEKRGLLTLHRGRIVVRDRQGLAALIGAAS